MPARERLSVAAAAKLAGVKTDTWRSYVTRKQAPAPDGVDEVFGRYFWYRATVQKWIDSRPRAGRS